MQVFNAKIIKSFILLIYFLTNYVTQMAQDITQQPLGKLRSHAISYCILDSM